MTKVHKGANIGLMNQVEDLNEIKRSERSSRYPAILLDFAIDVIREARKFGRDTNDIHIAGKGKPKGGAYIRKRASLGYYGLIEGRGGLLRITDLAESILYPQNEEEKLSSVRTAFLTPVLFNNLYQDIEKNVPLNIDILGNIIVRKYGISPAAQQEFLSTFIKSGIFADLIQYAEGKKDEIILKTFNEVVEKDKTIISQKEEIDSKENKALLNANQDYQIVELQLENGGKAKIAISGKMTKTDARKLQAQVNILANIFDDNNAG